jgi:hypothetical protein
MENKAQPPRPDELAPAVSTDDKARPSTVKAAEILESLRRLPESPVKEQAIALELLRRLPEGPVKEREKTRLKRTLFRDLQPLPRVGRKTSRDATAVALAVEVPAFQEQLRKVKGTLKRQQRLGGKPKREPPGEHVARITPIVRGAWRRHWAAWGHLGAFEPLRDPPDHVLAAAIQKAIDQTRQKSSPDLSELTARLFVWQFKLPKKFDSRAIRRLIARGKALCAQGSF